MTRVSSGHVARPPQAVVGHLLAHAGVFGGKEQVLDSHLFTHGELPGQLVDAGRPTEVGIAAEHQRLQVVVGQPLLDRPHLEGRRRLEKNVVHPQGRQVGPGVFLVLAVVHDADGQRVGQLGHPGSRLNVLR